jgi:hypothetical protein
MGQLDTQSVELTVRRKEGPLLTSLPTGDASSRLVEAPHAVQGRREQV